MGYMWHIVFMFTNTTIAGISLLFSPTIFTSNDMAAAQEASSASSNQAAESAGEFAMPKGDFGSEPSSSREPVVIPLRTPIPEAELQRLKELGGPSVPAPEVPADLVPANEPAPCGHGGPE